MYTYTVIQNTMKIWVIPAKTLLDKNYIKNYFINTNKFASYMTGKKYYGPIEKWYSTHNVCKEIPALFWVQIMGTPLLGGSIPLFTCHVNSL